MEYSRTTKRLFAIGIALLAFSYIWPMLVGGRRGYTPEAAAEYQRASVDLHNRIHSHGANDHEHAQASGGEDAQPAELKAAWEDFNKAQQARDAALNRGVLTSRISFFLGVVAAVGAVVSYMIDRLRQ